MNQNSTITLFYKNIPKSKLNIILNVLEIQKIIINHPFLNRMLYKFISS